MRSTNDEDQQYTWVVLTGPSVSKKRRAPVDRCSNSKWTFLSRRKVEAIDDFFKQDFSAGWTWALTTEDLCGTRGGVVLERAGLGIRGCRSLEGGGIRDLGTWGGEGIRTLGAWGTWGTLVALGGGGGGGGGGIRGLGRTLEGGGLGIRVARACWIYLDVIETSEYDVNDKVSSDE